jgi:hypothetical protein
MDCWSEAGFGSTIFDLEGLEDLLPMALCRPVTVVYDAIEDGVGNGPIL